DQNTRIKVGRRSSIDLSSAIAHSNNPYFAAVGNWLGFEKVTEYAHLFGLGEKAGLNIPEERPGILPDETPSSGVGMMTSFGDGITVTPLELAALVSTIANEGTLYYLQYPRTPDEASRLVPRVKRRLDIERWIPDVKAGMMGAVEFGTARRATFSATEPI